MSTDSKRTADWDVSRIHDLDKAQAKVYENAHFRFPRDTLAGRRVEFYLTDMVRIGLRRAGRAFWIGLLVGLAVALGFGLLLRWIPTNDIERENVRLRRRVEIEHMVCEHRVASWREDSEFWAHYATLPCGPPQ